MSAFRSGTAIAIATCLSIPLASACSKSHMPKARPSIQLINAFKAVPKGRSSIIAEVPTPSTAPPDERARLASPQALLAAPDGGLIVVTENDISPLTWITRDGRLEPYILRDSPRYEDGTSPADATSAYQESSTEVLLATRTGELVRVATTRTSRIGRLPKHASAVLISGPRDNLYAQQGGDIYRLQINDNSIDALRFHPRGLPHGFFLDSIAEEDSAFIADDGNSIIRISPKGKVILRSQITKDHAISSAVSDGQGGAYAGTSRGEIMHVFSDGTIARLVNGHQFAHDCLSRQQGSPLGDASSMLLRSTQLYIADRVCNRIVKFGV